MNEVIRAYQETAADLYAAAQKYRDEKNYHRAKGYQELAAEYSYYARNWMGIEN